MNSFHIYRNPFADKNTVISKNGAEANQAFLFLLITLYNFHYSSLDSKLFYYWWCLPFKSKNWKCIPWNVMLGKIMSLWDGGEKNVQHKTILWKRGSCMSSTVNPLIWKTVPRPQLQLRWILMCICHLVNISTDKLINNDYAGACLLIVMVTKISSTDYFLQEISVNKSTDWTQTEFPAAAGGEWWAGRKEESEKTWGESMS